MSLLSPFEQIYELYGYDHFLFEEEDVMKYRPGGYHPVALGDILEGGRYKIYHKFGHGGFSTVWAARDNKLEQWVSVKIKTADSTNKSQEPQILRALAEHSGRSLDSQNIVQLLDDILHEGPNGCHQCLVFELLGPTVNLLVDDCAKSGERLETESIFRISTQLLQAVAFMHEAGYAHGVKIDFDLSIFNLAIHSSRLSRCSEEELFEILGVPDSDFLSRVDGKPLDVGVPSQLVKSSQWPGWYEDGDDDDLRIIDLGEAFSQDAVPERLGQPADLKAPETILADSFDHRVDLWRVGLIIYYLIIGSYPFCWWTNDFLVVSMIGLLGEIPQEWQPQWEQLRLGAGGKFGPKEKGQLSDFRIEQIFTKRDVQDRVLTELIPVIKGLMRFLPADRISAAHALEMVRDIYEGAQRGEASDDDSDT